MHGRRWWRADERRIQDLDRAAGAGGDVEIRGYVVADEIDHRHHVGRTAAGDGEDATVRGARAVARTHRAAAESDCGQIDELVDVLAEARNVAGKG